MLLDFWEAAIKVEKWIGKSEIEKAFKDAALELNIDDEHMVFLLMITCYQKCKYEQSIVGGLLSIIKDWYIHKDLDEYKLLKRAFDKLLAEALEKVTW